MNALSLLKSMHATTLQVTRRRAATYTAGRAVPGETSTVQIVGLVVPASGLDLQRLPEGRRTVETRKLFTTSILYVGGQGATYEADLVRVSGLAWEVQNVSDWSGHDGAFEALLQRPSS